MSATALSYKRRRLTTLVALASRCMRATDGDIRHWVGHLHENLRSARRHVGEDGAEYRAAMWLARNVANEIMPGIRGASKCRGIRSLRDGLRNLA